MCVCLYVAAVVLDCVNMAPSAGKVTPRDTELVVALEKRFPALPARGALFQQLNDAKFDVSGKLSWTAVNQTFQNMCISYLFVFYFPNVLLLCFYCLVLFFVFNLISYLFCASLYL